jgi:hypothetical protein
MLGEQDFVMCIKEMMTHGNLNPTSIFIIMNLDAIKNL